MCALVRMGGQPFYSRPTLPFFSALSPFPTFLSPLHPHYSCPFCPPLFLCSLFALSFHSSASFLFMPSSVNDMKSKVHSVVYFIQLCGPQLNPTSGLESAVGSPVGQGRARPPNGFCAWDRKNVRLNECLVDIDRVHYYYFIYICILPFSNTLENVNFWYFNRAMVPLAHFDSPMLYFHGYWIYKCLK